MPYLAASILPVPPSKVIKEPHGDPERVGGCRAYRRLRRVGHLSAGDPAVHQARARDTDHHQVHVERRWNELFWPLIVVNSPSMKTVTMGLIGRVQPGDGSRDAEYPAHPRHFSHAAEVGGSRGRHERP
jgi:hypothetical protein